MADVQVAQNRHDADDEVAGESGEQEVTPWDVKGGADGRIDYDKLTTDFGVAMIKEDMVSRIERLTNRRAHPFLRRGVVFAHRDLVRASSPRPSPSPTPRIRLSGIPSCCRRRPVVEIKRSWGQARVRPGISEAPRRVLCCDAKHLEGGAEVIVVRRLSQFRPLLRSG
jgi:hypothetical protein